jgi:hypothetical protein
LSSGRAEDDEIRDNLDLERGSRLPERHEQEIQSRRHAGLYSVLEETTLCALESHATYPGSFTVDEPNWGSSRRGAMDNPDEIRRAGSFFIVFVTLTVTGGEELPVKSASPL